MQIEFYKYQGTGNDFILVDNRQREFPKNDTELVAALCNRQFGIGADGLILLENDSSTNFYMRYFNADGNPGSMCGNGGRCIVAFARRLGIIGGDTSFKAADGLHHATIEDGVISLQMKDVTEIKQKPNYLFLDTGSPHHVQLVKNLDGFDVLAEGRRLRYGVYGKSGSNINFVESKKDNVFEVRTYERGVEDETLSCGTGVTAVALGMHFLGKTNTDTISVNTRGGTLVVTFEPFGGGYRDIYLKGPAMPVFKGTWPC